MSRPAATSAAVRSSRGGGGVGAGCGQAVNVAEMEAIEAPKIVRGPLFMVSPG
jgi:hypothetical protein